MSKINNVKMAGGLLTKSKVILEEVFFFGAKKKIIHGIPSMLDWLFWIVERIWTTRCNDWNFDWIAMVHLWIVRKKKITYRISFFNNNFQKTDTKQQSVFQLLENLLKKAKRSKGREQQRMIIKTVFFF